MEQPESHPPDTTPLVASASTSRRSSLHIPRKTSWGDPISPPSSFEAHRPSISQEKLFEDVDLESNCDGSITSTHVEDGVTLHDISTLGLSFSADDDKINYPVKSRFPLEDSIEFPEQASKERSPVPTPEHQSYNKYLKNLRRMGAQRRKTVSCDIGSSLLQKEFSNVSAGTSGAYTHKKSSSGSSFGFVTAVKSASISLASFSVAPKSRRTAISSHHTRADNSRASNAPRVSEDSTYIARSVVIDQAVTNRLLHRRRILEEIINTEESYVADVRFLRNVYVTLLASMPPISQSLRASINRNLNEIVGLHDEILGELHRAVPHSEYTQKDYMDPKPTSKSHGHNRWRSLDGVAANIGGSLLQKIPGMTAEPKVAAEVARVFGRKMNRLFIYEEYGAKYEMMIRDISTAHRTMPQWETYQKGLEALASSLASINNQFDASKKALTVGDLLVKPIQRVCKYPLLFAELLKQTPVCDCPESHGEIDSVLVRLREATAEINRATDDPRMKATMEKTWLLQDRLQFPEKPSSLSKNIMRSLGHIHLCGVLHGSWQTKDSVDGQYLVCLMYRDFLVLATAHPKVDNIYLAQACIALSQIRVEDVDNGRGLQCHTAPFSWKLVFEFDHRLFEITMSACSPKEELEWRSRLVDRASKEPLDAGEEVEFTSLSLSIKPMGTVFGKPGTIARRISIHRATTVGPLTGLCQVIIRNTNAFKEIPHSASFSSSCTSINRSQSLLTTNRIPILSPSRAERIRLESMLSDVWTREILPFPGMTGRARSEHLVRSSASSMMRKLSKASITSNFTKRSGSVTSLKMASEEEEEGIGGEQHATTTEHLNGDPKLHEHIPSRLAAIVQNEEKRFHEASVDSRPNSSAGNNKRHETLKLKKNQWVHDGQKTITPPLRTSSANSWSASQGNLGEAITREEKENLLHELHGTKHEKLRKGSGKRTTSLVAESIRNFFR